LKVEYIAHKRDIASRRKEMIVIEAAKDTANLRISEIHWPFEGGDAGRQMLPGAEVPRSPCDLLPQRHQAAGDASNRALAGVNCGVHMQINAARKVEDALDRRLNVGAELNYGHKRAQA
jgi:hypothetical protein